MKNKKDTPKKPKKYLNNKDLLAAFYESREAGEMRPKLALMLQTLCARYGRRGNFVNYTYNEDMQAYAMMMLVKTWGAFNPEKNTNAFAFYTQCIHSSFLQFLNQERRQRDIRDSLLMDKGMTPSFTFQMEYENVNNSDKKPESDYLEDNNYNNPEDNNTENE